MHSHILPELDDGSKSVELSLEIIEKLKSQGVNNICFTPHFYTNEESMTDFLSNRKKSADKLIPLLPDDINYCVGAEVYVTNYLFNNSDLSGICYGNSKYILCEFSFDSQFQEHTMNYFYKLQSNYGLKPVLTHIERYHHLMEDESLVENLVDDGIIIQSNVGAFKGFSQKRRLLKYIKRGYISILGTDCHSLTRGNPDEYLTTINLIKEKCGAEYIENIISMSAKIFNSAIK
jgi:protein-tyrosine phosphatase